eukprot:CAMPEP_0119056150 /NCGR_PEP_ID=MMETSP1178-20130426/848_1 /TAXON_ID=33656 /ORGANISM="unid sp, Strain CCMP2000" /LENGTH=417 /DNA_ID=CAMNT_0007036851 /DNA_START=122 /DNA_END=1375 /DNA_ORIENTATION=+
MPPKADAKAAQIKKIDDKTFGMKNKNKSKQVQSKIAQMKGGGAAADDYAKEKKLQQKAAADALDMVLFKEAKKKNEIKKAAEMACQAKKDKDKEPEKRDIHVDLREQKEADLMVNWSEEKLKEVIEKKKRGGDGMRVQTDIVCKHFLDAIETKKYGWFWECPNGGDKCQYRHALPPGYVLKSEIKEVEKKEELLEDRIERERQALTTRTPVTLDRLQVWLKEKQERKAQQEEKVMEEAKQSYAKGKRPVISGRALFAIDPSLFIDDDGAAAEPIEREEDSDEEEDERKTIDFTPLAGPSAAEQEQMAAARAAEREAARAAEREAEVAVPAAPAEAAARPAKAEEQSSSADGSGVASGHAEGANSLGGDGGEAVACSAAVAERGEAEAERPAALAAADLEGVDESLFLGEDFDDIEVE